MDECNRESECNKGFCKKAPSSTSTKTFFPPNFCRSPGVPTSALNPGAISNLHKKTRDLTPEWIEGLTLRCAKNFDVNKAFYVEWMMGNNTPVGFRLGGMLCRKDKDSITKTPLIVGNTNPTTFATNLDFLYHPMPQIKILSKIQTGAYPHASEVVNTFGLLEYMCKNDTISLALYKPKRESGRMTIGFLHSFTDKFCAGAELMLAWSNRNHLKAENLAFAGRYTFQRCSLALSVSKDVFDFSVWHQPSESWQIGSSFIFDRRASKALGSFCYQVEMKDTVIKGMIDSDWSIGCTYNRQLKNLASTFGFSVLFCIPTNKFYCGLKYELNSNLQ